MAVSKKSAENISKVLSEALPYIQKFSGKTIAVSYTHLTMPTKA